MRDSQKYLASMSRSLPIGLALIWPIVAQAGGIDAQKFDQIERGRYLTIVGDCVACHTLPGSGYDFAGGRPLETPFGVLVGPNITPDPQTGIGAWTDDEFVNALKKGTGRGGALLFPATPYTYYTKVTRDDALAIRAYLNTVPAVHNPVNPDQLPFPLSARTSMTVWNKLFFTPGEFQPDGSKSTEWNRGAYLTEGLGHCGMCHTPRLAATRQPNRCRAIICRGGSRPTSPTTCALGWVRGRSTTSPLTSRPATIKRAPLRASWRKRLISRRRK
jgi:mono/diheme cytochrome c family protein